MKAGITLGFKPKESDLTAISMLSLSSPSAASTVIFYLYYCTSQRPVVMVICFLRGVAEITLFAIQMRPRVLISSIFKTPGVEVSITEPEDLITVKDAKIVVESQDEDKIQVRVDLTGDATQRVFDKVLTNLARSAPPIPGFRREKGGKTTKVPRDFLIQILGEERVTKFVVQEIVSSTLTDYTKKEGLNVKDKKVTTTQKAEELRKSFYPGNEFGFSAVLELEKSEVEESETETSSSSSSDEENDEVPVS
ncbi:hypothetical protein WN944_015994 [Citrus x changshan-huyou]|uniref:peptidylprolyl isomerase n=1 Tax=Citrus x changshan-huyou TaxID=2935761 RepID=A0AAP0QN60_9ROSI